MIIVHKRQFFVGLIMLICFFAVFAVVLSPVMNGRTILQFSDNLFDSLSKGSTYKIPGVAKSADKFTGQQFTVSVKAKSADQATGVSNLLTAAGAAVKVNKLNVTVSGDLGLLAKKALADADVAFKQGSKAESTVLSGMKARDAAYYWWTVFSPLQKQYLQQNDATRGLFAGSVMTKALEPAYNFGDIPAVKVSERGNTLTFMLLFYMMYTVWYGFAIMYLFEGLGITTTRAKEKQEA